MALCIRSRDKYHESSACVDHCSYGISKDWIRANLKRRNTMGDKGKKDKDKVRKQKKNKQDQEVKRMLEKQPKRIS
jgi:Fe-S oxidoreductase